MLDEWHESRSVLALITEEAEEKAWEQIAVICRKCGRMSFNNWSGTFLPPWAITRLSVAQKERACQFRVYADSLGWAFRV